MSKQIYFDHNATTPVDGEVFEAMKPYLTKEWGNPSSIHWAGRGPRKAIDDAREQVCEFLGCTPVELIFTSSGSESDNLAIKGVAYARKKKGNHIITTKVEHPAVLNPCKFLEREGFKVTYLGVDNEGMLDLDELRAAITPETTLITAMFANNETGVIFPIKEIGAIAREHKVAFHTDAVQSAGKIAIDVKDLNVDLLSISGHKLYAPKGMGALYVKRGVRLVPLIHGGHHERNRRGGTENVAGIVGLAKACEVATRDMEEETKKVAVLRDRLEQGLLKVIPALRINGKRDARIPNTANVAFDFVEGESLLLSMDMLGIAAASGSACTSGSLESSHVLMAMGVKPELTHGSVRFSLGRSNTEEEVDYLIKEMPPIVERIRSMSPLWDSKAQKGIDLDFDEKVCT